MIFLMFPPGPGTNLINKKEGKKMQGEGEGERTKKPKGKKHVTQVSGKEVRIVRHKSHTK